MKRQTKLTHAQKPRTFAPVGISVPDLKACADCGYSVCSCERKTPVRKAPTAEDTIQKGGVAITKGEEITKIQTSPPKKNQFSVKVASKEPAPPPEDPRELVDRLFLDSSLEHKGVMVIDCSLKTAFEQGFMHGDFHKADAIPVYLNYKGDVPGFKGPTKGKDFVIIGQRVGPVNRGGNPGQMLVIDQIPLLIEHLQNLHESLGETLKGVREQLQIK
jgi:hypothetical protein